MRKIVYACAGLVIIAVGCASGSSGFGTDAGPGVGGDASSSPDAALGTADGAPDDAANPNDSGGGGGGDTGIADSGGDSGAQATGKSGYVLLTQSKAAGASIYSTYAAAGFSDGTATPVPSSCISSVMGICTVSECDLTAPPGPRGDAGTPSSAGIVSLVGAMIPVAGIVLTENGGRYTAKSGNTQLFAGNNTLSVSAAGQFGGVPAFTGTLAAPGDLVVTPPLSNTTPTLINRDVNFVLSWTGGAAGKVYAGLSTVEQSKKSVTVACEVAGSAGGVTVPAAALAKLQSTNGGSVSGTIYVSPYNTTTITAGTFVVRFSAFATNVGGVMQIP